MARGKSVIQVVITGESRGLKRATDAAAGAFAGFSLAAVKLVSVAASVTSAIGVASVKAFADFDAAMTQSTAIMGNVSQAMEQDMSNAAREVAKTTTFSAQEAAQAYFYLASAGLDAEQSVAALPQVAQFAQAGMFDLSRATDLLTDAQSALGLTIRDDAQANMENMAQVADVLVKANTLANASVEQFSQSLTNKAGAALSVANKSIEEGVAVLAVFADQGVKGAEAGERLSVMLRDITRAGAANADEFAKLGLRVFDAEGNLRNMADVTAEFERVLGPMSDAQKAATLDTLGLTRSVADNIKLVLGSSEQMRDYQQSLEDAGGTTEDVANKQLQTFSAQLQLVRSHIGDVFLTIGSRLVPALLDLFENFGGMERVEEITTRVAGAFNRAWFTQIKPFMEGLGGEMPGVVSQVVEIFDEYMRPALENMGDLFFNYIIPAVVEAAQFFRSDIIPVMMQFGEFVRDNILPIVNRLTRLFLENLVPTLKNFLRPIIESVSDVLERLQEKWDENEDKINGFLDVIEPLVTFVRDTVAPVFGVVLGGALELVGGIVGGLIDLFGDLLADITAVIDEIVNFGRKIADSRVGQAVGGIIDAISGRQFGGPVHQGQAYIVGEAGPELFVPTISGSIVPNNEMGVVGGGGGQTIINLTVTSADPEAVVQAIRRYTRYNGPLGQVVTL